jgi:hypothetical protein
VLNLCRDAYYSNSILDNWDKCRHAVKIDSIN